MYIHVINLGMCAKAQQRGVDGTRELISALFSGLDVAHGTTVYLVDLLPNRPLGHVQLAVLELLI